MRLPRLRVLVLAAMVLATVATLAWWIWGPPGVAVELTRRGWRMEIVVEALREEAGSDWCDELPAGAFDIHRRTISDPTGRRSEPAEHCRYNQLAWRRSWIVKNEGGPSDRPEWPSPPLRVAPPGQPGSERLGKRDAFFYIELRDRSNHGWTCLVAQAQWQQLREGQRFRIPVDRFGTANCALMVASRF